MSDTIVIEAPSRLHFGMFSFGASGLRQFGGVGLMVDQPRLRMVFKAASRFTCTGLHAERGERICRQVAQRWLDGRLPRCAVAIESAPREHSGLGLGTQLSLAAGVGLTRFCGVAKPPSVYEVAGQLGRAHRSSVGTHGFVHGGLIVDAGHAAGEPIGALADRVELPPAWRVVLVTPQVSGGLSGGPETKAFGELPAVTLETTGRLTSEVLLEMLPAIRNGDFDAFSHSVYRFGRTAGECFAAVQGGPFSEAAAELVERIRRCGVGGVGQSSWGPTVFAFADSESAADRLRQQLSEMPAAKACEIRVSRPNNHGAVVEAASTAA
jgi:beta-ribofuranosylaminobenzene 5'-phosphate synthase